MNSNENNVLKYSQIDFVISKVASVCVEKLNKHWKHDPQSNPYHRILFVYDGNFEAIINHESVIIEKNDIVYVPKNVNYVSKSISPNFHYVSIFFEIVGESLFSKGFNMINKANLVEKFSKLFSNASEEWITKNFGYKLKVKILLYDILRTLLIEQLMLSNSLRSYNTIRNSINYIDRNYYKETISINELAKISNITPTHFVRVFKEVYQTTPKKYINKLRIDHAVELLEHSTASINEIAEQLGYNDVAYFSKTFKQEMGKSPLKYRMNT